MTAATTTRTPGPWHMDAAGLVYCEDAFFGKCTIAQCELAPLPGTPGRMGQLRGNAAFIVTACNAHDALLADRDRLRAALQAIADAERAKDSYPGEGWRLAHEKICGYARAALAQSEKGE